MDGAMEQIILGLIVTTCNQWRLCVYVCVCMLIYVYVVNIYTMLHCYIS